MSVLRSLAQIASTVHPHVSRRMTVATEYKLLLCCFLSVISVSLSSDTLSGENLAATEEAAKTAFFETHIRPLLVDHCYECHSRESGESDGNLLLDSAASLLKGGDRGPALIPGKPQQSLLLRVVHYREKDLQMPPKGKLSDRQIESLRQWIESGAFDPRTEPANSSGHAEKKTGTSHLDRDPRTHWAFTPPVRHVGESVPGADTEDPIDAFAALAAKKTDIASNQRADRVTLIKRLYFDLTGLPPSHSEIEAFAATTRRDAYQRLVDSLLASPFFGERFARHWLDVARYADTVGYALGGKERRISGSHHYRDWTIRAFSEDMPYDEMIQHQLAADRTDPDNEHGNLEAMGFLTLGRQFLNPLDTIDDRIDVITRGLLGLTVSCARCHDHKFDPIPTEDYYALGGIIASSQRPKNGASPLMLVDKPNPVDSPVLIRGQPGNRGAVVPRRFLTALQADGESRFTDGSGRKELAQRIATAENPLTARVMVNRVWTILVGRPLVNSPSDFGFRTEKPAIPEVLDDLAADFATHWSIKKLVRRIVLSKIYQQSSSGNDTALTKDPENRLLARGNRRRRDFESLRDAMLAVSNNLDFSQGGEPVVITGNKPAPRRTVYAMIDRQNLPSLFRTFDFANPDAHSPGRYFTTVPQQALFLMNSPQMMAIAKATATSARPRTITSPDLRSQVTSLFTQVLGREPTVDELQASVEFLEEPSRVPVPNVDPRSLWSYGAGKVAPTDSRTISEFHAFRHFQENRWQAGPKFPTAFPFSHAFLGKSGGHTPSDPDMGTIRRYTAPRDEVITVSGNVAHNSEQGDGVVFSIHAKGEIIYESTQFHSSQTHGPHTIRLQAGETIDFVATSGTTSSFDSFGWTARLQSTSTQGNSTDRDTETHFSGPFTPEKTLPLDRLEQLSQILILSNEFAFVD